MADKKIEKKIEDGVKKVRNFRSKEERIADLDKKIDFHKKSIEAFEAKKAAIMNPPARAKRVSTKAVIDKAKELGMDAKEIAEKLGIDLQDN